MPPYSPDSCAIAVLIPCYNEAAAIAQVVTEFRRHLPDAEVHVFDNNSTDGSMDIARKAGARIGRVSYQGKGHVVRKMFADVDADIYVLVDGDGTYDAASALKMVDLLLENRLDMVVGTRRHVQAGAYRAGHVFGNRLLTRFLNTLFGKRNLVTDILSGYRVFSRRYVKSFPALSRGFETETELTVHALELHMPIGEMETPYGARAEGSESKLNTYRDGFRILMTMLNLFEKERPLVFFGLIFLLLLLLAIGLGLPLVVTYLQTGLVPRIPTTMGVTGIVVLSFLSLVSGIIMDSVALGRREMKRLAYLSIPAPNYCGNTQSGNTNISKISSTSE